MARRTNGSRKQKSTRAKQGHTQASAPKKSGRSKRSLLSRLKFW